MEKCNYEKPVLNVAIFNVEDVVRTSVELTFGVGVDGNEMESWWGSYFD